MYWSRKIQEAAEKAHRESEDMNEPTTGSAQEMTLEQWLEKLPEDHLARRQYRKLLNDTAAEIHMAEVQRDKARAAAKGIILDLIAEFSAKELKCWLCGPHQFKLAAIARLENWTL